jgi:hypothetical protein
VTGDDWTSNITARDHCRAVMFERLRSGVRYKAGKAATSLELSVDFGDDQGGQAAAVMG